MFHVFHAWRFLFRFVFLTILIGTSLSDLAAQDAYSSLKDYFKTLENASAFSVKTHFQSHHVEAPGVGLFGFADAEMQWAKKDEMVFVGLWGSFKVIGTNQRHHKRHEFVYDGNVYLRIESRKNKKDRSVNEFTSVYAYDKSDGIAASFDRYYFFLGALTPGTSDRIVEKNLYLPKNEYFASQMLKRFKNKYKQRTGTVQHGNFTCVVLEYEGRDIWYLDQSTMLPVYRLYFAPRSTNAKLYEIEFKNYETLGSELRLPKQIVVKTFANVLYEPERANTHLQTIDIRVSEFLYGDQVPDSLFKQVSLPKGTQVHDMRNDTSFRLESNENDLLNRISIAEPKERKGRSFRRNWRWIYWSLIILGVVVGLTAGYSLWRKRNN